jgi:indolepyruvate ferredoxin oxidoreductase beta subunit
VIGNAALNDGYDVRIGETLGMAQRGGSFFSFIRFGSGVYSPLISSGEADILICLEPIEGLRASKYLSKENTELALINTSEIPPIPVTLGTSRYPEKQESIDQLKLLAKRVIALNALSIAEELGNLRVMNTVMLGALYETNLLPIKMESIQDSLRWIIPERYQDINNKAFQAGVEYIQKH